MEKTKQKPVNVVSIFVDKAEKKVLVMNFFIRCWSRGRAWNRVLIWRYQLLLLLSANYSGPSTNRIPIPFCWVYYGMRWALHCYYYLIGNYLWENVCSHWIQSHHSDGRTWNKRENDGFVNIDDPFGSMFIRDLRFMFYVHRVHHCYFQCGTLFKVMPWLNSTISWCS